MGDAAAPRVFDVHTECTSTDGCLMHWQSLESGAGGMEETWTICSPSLPAEKSAAMDRGCGSASRVFD